MGSSPQPAQAQPMARSPGSAGLGATGAVPPGKVHKILGVVNRWRQQRDRQLVSDCFSSWGERCDDVKRMRVIIERLSRNHCGSLRQRCFGAWAGWVGEASAAARADAAAKLQRQFRSHQRGAALRELRRSAIAAKARAEATAQANAAVAAAEKVSLVADMELLQQELRVLKQSQLEGQHAALEVGSELAATREAATLAEAGFAAELQEARNAEVEELAAAREAAAASVAGLTAELHAVRAAELAELSAAREAAATAEASLTALQTVRESGALAAEGRVVKLAAAAFARRIATASVAAAFVGWSELTSSRRRSKLLVQRRILRCANGQLLSILHSWQSLSATSAVNRRHTEDIAAKDTERAAEVSELAEVLAAEKQRAATCEEAAAVKHADLETQLATVRAEADAAVAAREDALVRAHATHVDEMRQAQEAEIEQMQTAAAATERKLAAQALEAEASLRRAAESASATEESYKNMLAQQKVDADATMRELADEKAAGDAAFEEEVARHASAANELAGALETAKEIATMREQAAADALVLAEETARVNEEAAAASHAVLESTVATHARSAAELAEALAAEKKRAATCEQAAAMKHADLETQLATVRAEADAAVAARIDALVRQAQDLSSEVAAARMEGEAATHRAWATNAAAFHTARSSTRDVVAQCTLYTEMLAAERAAEDSAKRAQIAADTEERKWVQQISGQWAAEGSDENGPGVQELVFLYVSLDGVVTGKVDDGDGIEDEDDCIIMNGRFDHATRFISFDQVYSDGATTKWTARYDPQADRLLDGTWSGECRGTFAAVRKSHTGAQIPSVPVHPVENLGTAGHCSEARLELTKDEALQIAALMDMGLKDENDDNTRQIREISRALEQSKEAERRVVLERDQLLKKISDLEHHQLEDSSIPEVTDRDLEVKSMRQRRLQEPHTKSGVAEAALAELREAQAEAATWKRQYFAMEGKTLQLEEELAQMQPQLDVSAKLFEDVLHERTQVAQEHVAAARIQHHFHAYNHRKILRELRHAKLHASYQQRRRLSMVVVGGQAESTATVDVSRHVEEVTRLREDLDDERAEKALAWKRMQRRIAALEEELEQHSSARQQDLEAITATVVSAAAQKDAIVSELRQEQYAHALTRREVEIAWSPQNSPVAGVRTRTGSLPSPNTVSTARDAKLSNINYQHSDTGSSSDDEAQCATNPLPTPPSETKPEPTSSSSSESGGSDTDDSVAEQEPSYFEDPKACLTQEAGRARVAAEEAEQARVAAEEAEQERIAVEEAEQARVAVEEAEQERIAVEEAEQARVAVEEAKQQHRAQPERRKSARRGSSKPKAPPGKPTTHSKVSAGASTAGPAQGAEEPERVPLPAVELEPEPEPLVDRTEHALALDVDAVEPQSNGTQRFVKPLPQLPLQEESLPSTVKIANAQFEGKVCRYEITFVYSNGEQHSVSRRYSEFDQLRKDILALDSHVLQAVEGTAPRKPSDGIQVSPQPFPTNKWRQTKKVVDARKDSLSGWLNALLPYDSLAPVLMRFLGLSNSRRKTYSRLDGDSELLVQVLRWMYVKDPSKSGKKPYVVYEITVSGPFPGGPTTKVYHQRWSQLYKFQDRFDTWSKRTAKIRDNPQRLPSKNTAASDDPQRLQGRTNELNRWAANLSAWANNMSAQGAVELENFLDEVVEPCFGEDRGGKSPTGRRAELDCSEQDHVGWLNLMHQNKSEPYFVVLAKAGVELAPTAAAASGERPVWKGDEKGTLAMYHGPREQLAHQAVPISGRFFSGKSQVEHKDKGSPRAMRGLYTFSMQWHQMDIDRSGASALTLKQLVFTTSDGEAADEWIRTCRTAQRRHFADWNAEELGMWLQATGLFAADEPMKDCGVFANAVMEFVQRDDQKGLRRSLKVPLQKGGFSDLWRALQQVLVDNLEELGLGEHDTDSAATRNTQELQRAFSSTFSPEKLQQFIEVSGVGDEETARECLEDADWDVQAAVERFLADPPPAASAPADETGYYSLKENPLEETLDKPEPMPSSRRADAKAAAAVLCERGGWVDSLKMQHDGNWGWVPEWPQLKRLYAAHNRSKLGELDSLVLKYSATKLFSEAIKKYEPDSAESWLLSEGFSSVEVCQVKLRFDDSDAGLGSFTPKLLRGLGLEEIRELAARVGGPTDRGHLDAGGAAATAAQQAAEEHGGAEEAPDEWSDSSEDERLFAS